MTPDQIDDLLSLVEKVFPGSKIERSGFAGRAQPPTESLGYDWFIQIEVCAVRRDEDGNTLRRELLGEAGLYPVATCGTSHSLQVRLSQIRGDLRDLWVTGLLPDYPTRANGIWRTLRDALIRVLPSSDSPGEAARVQTLSKIEML